MTRPCPSTSVRYALVLSALAVHAAEVGKQGLLSGCGQAQAEAGDVVEGRDDRLPAQRIGQLIAEADGAQRGRPAAT